MEGITIQEYLKILKEKDNTLTSKEIGDKLKISQPMVSQYKNNKGYNASLAVAIEVYKQEKIVLFPFGEYALKELTNA
jgi:predicted transcriptional regulator